MFHAEDHSLVTYFTERVKKLGDKPELHDEARPPLTEAYSIAKISNLAKHAGRKVHIVHVLSIEALEEIASLRRPVHIIFFSIKGITPSTAP